MFPFVAAWLARCDKLGEMDLSFLKSITIGGSVLDNTTVELIAKRLPQVAMVQVGFT
jgi:non-ribosomal peptide synthetase component E (peptide arylation enzyme)